MRQLKITTQITNRDSEAVEKYLQEIGKTQMITPEQEIELAIARDNGNPDAANELAFANLRFVVSVAKQYQYQGLSLSDLINEGNLGLIKAAQRFDHTRGFKFISYAVRWIRQSILQALAEQGRLIRLPQNKISTNNKINKQFIKMSQEEEREPTIDEIAEAMDLSPEEVQSGLEAYGFHESLDKQFGEDDDRTMYDIMENPDAKDTDNWIESQSMKDIFLRLFASLPQRERDIMNNYFTLDPDNYMSIDQLEAKYDLTKERMRQIKERIIKRRQEKKARRIRQELAGESTKIHIMRNFSSQIIAPQKDTLISNSKAKIVKTLDLNGPTDPIIYGKKSVETNSQPYMYLTDEQVEQVQNIPTLPDSVGVKHYSKTLLGLGAIARNIGEEQNNTRYICTVDVFKKLVGIKSSTPGINIVRQIQDIADMTEEIIGGKVLEHYTTHKSSVRANHMLDFTFTPWFLEYIRTLKTIDKRDIYEFRGKYAQTLFNTLLPHKHEKYKDIPLNELIRVLNITSKQARKSMEIGNYYPIRDALFDINTYSSINVKCYRHENMVRFEITPKNSN